MKDLTSSLRALADFLDRDEFEGVRLPKVYQSRGTCRAEWAWPNGGRSPVVWFTNSGPCFSVNGPVLDLDPMAEILPQPLVEALDVLKGDNKEGQ